MLAKDVKNRLDWWGKTWFDCTEIFISNHYLEKKLAKFPKTSLVYLASCNTLNNDLIDGKKIPDFANAFNDKGVDVVLGYTGKGHAQNEYDFFNSFISELEKDKTCQDAFNTARNDNNLSIRYKNVAEGMNMCFFHTEFKTLKPEECKFRERNSVLGLKINNWDALIKKYGNITECGIIYGTSPNLNLSNSKNVYTKASSIREGEITYTVSNLEFEKIHYYRAYLIADGKAIYGDEYSFLTKDVEFRRQLKNIYIALDGENNWGDNTNWLNEEVPLTRWAGISLPYSWSDEYLNEYYSLSITLKEPVAKSLSLNKCDKLSKITIYGPYGEDFFLKGINVSNCNYLKSIYCLGLQEFTANDCENLENLNLSKLVKCIVRNCPKLEDISISDKSHLKQCNIYQCPSLKEISLSYAHNLKSLIVNNCEKLKNVYCAHCDLHSLDLSNCKNIKTIDCLDNQLRTLDFDSEKLEFLDCSYNPLSKSYESIPNYPNINLSCDIKYSYTYDNEIFIPISWYIENMGYIGIVDEWMNEMLGYKSYILFKYNYEDEHGFYHVGEPDKEAYYRYYGR